MIELKPNYCDIKLIVASLAVNLLLFSPVIHEVLRNFPHPIVTLRGIGHRSSPAGSARDPTSLAYARSGFRFCPLGIIQIQKHLVFKLGVFVSVTLVVRDWNLVINSVKAFRLHFGDIFA
jgi:hypothetical protein